MATATTTTNAYQRKRRDMTDSPKKPTHQSARVGDAEPPPRLWKQPLPPEVAKPASPPPLQNKKK
jgi:hypothetical protein